MNTRRGFFGSMIGAAAAMMGIAAGGLVAANAAVAAATPELSGTFMLKGAGFTAPVEQYVIEATVWCEGGVFDTLHPGDTVQLNGRVFVVNAKVPDDNTGQVMLRLTAHGQDGLG